VNATRIRALVLGLLAFAATIGVTVTVVSDSEHGRVLRIEVRKDPTPTPAERLPVRPAPAEFDANPPGGLGVSAQPPASVERRQDHQVDAGTYDTSGVLKGATAQPAHQRCYTPQNGGARSIKAIGLMVAHVTVSVNVNGTRDGDALCGFFRRVKASPTWTVDNEGNSWENVPLDRVPWTQAWYNRPACSIEYIGSTGRPGEGPAQWTDAQLREGGRLFAKCAKLAGIPIRAGAVNDATGSILRTGLVTHQSLGLRGGGHTDPGPYWSPARQLYWIRYWINGAITPTDRATCRKLTWWRAHGRPRGAPEHNAVRRRHALEQRAVTCTHGAVRRR
jgi:hypothetical protein